MTKVESGEKVIKKNQITAGIWRGVTIFSAVLTVLVLGFLIVYILVKGVPHLTPELFAWEYDSENVSMLPALINTLEMTILTLAVAIPFGIGSAIYLVEYASTKNRFVPVVRMTAETLTGIPSIVYGLFGMLFFNSMFGISMLSGALTLGKPLEDAQKLAVDFTLECIRKTVEDRERVFYGVNFEQAIPMLISRLCGK